MPSKIEIVFDLEMRSIYGRALHECGYRATRFLQLVAQLGGVKVAKHLLRTSKWPTEGLTELSTLNRLDLSMEVLVLKDPWRTLFTDSELDEARKWLARLGWKEAPK